MGFRKLPTSASHAIGLIAVVGAAGCTLLNSFDGYSVPAAEDGGASSSSSSSSSSASSSGASSSSGTLVGPTDAAPPVVTPDATADAGVCPPSPDPALLAFYRFEEGKGTTATDCSGKGNHGKITGGAFKAGKVGGGLFFDGTSTCIDIGADKGGGINAFTVAAWVNIVDYAYLSTARYIVAKSTDADLRGWRFGSEALGAFGGKVGRAAGGPFGVVTPQGSANNAWLFVAMVYAASGDMTVWIEGNKAGTAAAAPPVIEDTVAHLRVGCFTNSTGEQSYHFSGTMDEVRIYGRALSDAEMSALR